MGITINVSKVIYAQSEVTSYQESGVRSQDSGFRNRDIHKSAHQNNQVGQSHVDRFETRAF